MENITTFQTLYKRDTKGKIRTWIVETGEGPRLLPGTRTISGTADGAKVTSEWNMSAPKNVGRSNFTTATTQATAEAQALWDKRVEKEYFTNVADVDKYERFKPMLAHDFTKTPVEAGYTQPKLDGIRCVVDQNGMWTRSGKAITSCPHIWEELKDFMSDNPNVILDGELYNHSLKSDFEKIVSLVRKTKCRPEEIAESATMVEYHIYDMCDKDNTDMLFLNRSKWLAENVAGNMIVLVDTDVADTSAEIDRLYGEYTQAGYEGQMVRQNAPYQCKRSKSLLKRKEFITEEFSVVSVEEGQGAWSGYAKRFVLELADGRQFGSGVRGTQAQLKALLERTEKTTWATCRFFELSNDGVPRFPVVIDYGTGIRED